MKVFCLSMMVVFLIFSAYGQQDFKYYSQQNSNQDRYLNEQIFRNKIGGIFVDIGAHDGITLSNTYFFEKYLNWTGICFEPLPAPFQRLKVSRKALCINAAVAAVDGFADFVKAQGYTEMLSGLVSTYAPQHLLRLKNNIAKYGGSYEIVKIPTVRLNDVLKQYNINSIDYLSLDTEGSELEILQSIDYQLVTINVMSVENNYHDPHIKSFLEPKGFKMITVLGNDEIYVNISYKY